MSYSPENWQTISKLLDQALDLAREARDSWLEALPEPDSAFREQLREMLAHHAAAKTADFLETLPKLAAARDSIDIPTGLAGAATELRVGPYHLVRELGRGGMAVVWLAERADGQFTRTVALKVPLAGHTGTDMTQRFARERDILAKLEHPHIARFYDAGVAADGTPYFAMEFVEGQPIDDYCDAQQLNVCARLSLFRQVLDAVQYAHARLVIHRDLKPSNILVTGDGEVHLLDFGIAKLLGSDETAAETQLTEVHGRALTPSYASPEQIRGESLTTATDIYSLGVVLYQLLTGARPYKLKTSSPAQLELAIAEAEVVRPSAAVTAPAAATRGTTAPKLAKALRGDLDTILLKALKKDPGDRYASAGVFAEDLRRYGDGETVQARPDSAWYRARKFIERNRLAVGSAATVVVALAVGMGVALWQYQQAIEQARIAREEARTAAAVQNFMEGIFRANSGNQTDPIKARQRTAKQLLDEGAARVENALDDVPEAKLRVLRTLAQMYEEMDELNASAALHRQLHALAVRRFGESSVAAAYSLSDLGRVLSEAEDIAGARQALDSAVAILERNPDPTGRAEIARDLGLATLYTRVDPKKGVLPAERALDSLRRAPVSYELMISYILLGDNLQLANQLERARQVLAEGVATAPRAPGGARTMLVELHMLLGRVSGKLGDVDGAEQNFARALDLSNSDNGAAGLHSLVIMSLRGEMLADNGRLLEGAHWTGLALQHVLAWPDSADRSAQIPGFAGQDVRSLLRAGRPEQGIEVATIGLRYCDAKGDPYWPATLHALRGLAFVQLGQQVDAENDLVAARALIVSAGLETESVGRWAALAEARALVLRNSGAAALERWRRHLHEAALADEPQAQDIIGLADLAEFELAAGLHAPALAHVDQALRALSSRANRANFTEIESQVQLSRGYVLLKMQRAADAVVALGESVRLRATTMDVTRSPMLLEARLALAEALLARSDTAAAREQLVLSQKIVSQHAHLGEQYLTPMKVLRQRLKTA